MKANTAIALIIGAISLWLLHQKAKSKLNKKILILIVNLLSCLVILIGSLTLIQDIFQINLGIDQLVFQEVKAEGVPGVPGRMAPNSAVAFILLGAAIFFLNKRFYLLAQLLNIIGFLLGFLGLLGYLYGITEFYGIGANTAMALHTSLAFIFLFISNLFVYPNRGLMSAITNEFAGGIMARRLALAVISVPPFLGWLVLQGKRARLYDSEVGIALLGVLNVLVLGIIIWWNAKTLGMIDYQACHDSLTGLPNRKMFSDLLSASLINASRRQGKVAVMFLDLDRFNKINDILGHDIGDRLLKATAQRLTSCFREYNTIARWGGDEFTILLPYISNSEYAAKLAQKILDILKPPFIIDNHYLHITCSIGIAIYPQNGQDGDTLIKNADVALYNVKRNGRNNYTFYNPTINPEDSELLILENRLHHAWDRGEILLYYQPRVNITTGKITGIEALVRWQSPELGLVSPGKFIPIAEETGLIIPLGKWILQSACQEIKDWIDRGLSGIRVAVNLSARQFQESDLVLMVSQILTDTGLNSQFLELEITETIAMQNVKLTKEKLNQLSDMGIHISMDDFGTGYSSLNYLKQFPLHSLKIDRSFVSDITFDPCDLAIASAIVALGKGLNINVVAEGVETEAQLECLRQLGCMEIQGYFFSPPLPAKDTIELLKEHQSVCG
ncbi:putative bifunctional diguanylate cyclase/phosphodiesterase [Aerosakkonemataceae cyanobacterium BLCC-F154]|uniref:Bifunctional diguanylate cyclase/phosphodiesterase n=1 Tax=Floridaenema fluviatile BLCC-F154 TaxID=3153640 RepID=A0ABV4Y6F3_9CYAN